MKLFYFVFLLLLPITAFANTIQPTVLNTTHSIFSIQFLMTEPTVAGGHPNPYYKTYTYDQRTGKLLTLSDLFEKNSDFLNAISAYCRIILNKKFPADTRAYPMIINDGTRPTEKNFKNWNLSPKGLVIAFNAEQVAAFGQAPEGVQVVIPFDKLKYYKFTTYPDNPSPRDHD